jgi:hypothetical protein
MTNHDAPRRPTGLSGQEEEALRTLEKGYDPDGGALPDQELPVHDHRDRKPGDEARSVQGGAGGSQVVRDSAASPGAPDSSEGTRTGASNPSRALGDAQRRGLLPSAGVTTPPADQPDQTAAGRRR